MHINKLLKAQLSPVLTGGQTINKEMLDLIETISKTYDFFEDKLNTTAVKLENPENRGIFSISNYGTR